MQSEAAVLRAYLVAKELRHSSGTQAVLVVFSKHGLRNLPDRLYQEKAIPKRIVVFEFGRHSEPIEAALKEVPGALVFDRAG